MLHGFPDTGRVWDAVIQRLGPCFRCLAPNLPGLGSTPLPPGFAYTLEDRRDWVGNVLAEYRVEQPVNLVVHDHGGPFGLAWAVANPMRVKRIVAIDTLFHGDYRWHFWARVWRTPVLGELAMAVMNRAILTREVHRGSPGLGAEHIDPMYRRLTREARRNALRLYRASDPGLLAGGEKQLLSLAREKPFMVIWGGRDPYIPVSYAHRFGARRVEILDNCGHWPMLEAPDAVADWLAAFFSGD